MSKKQYYTLVSSLPHLAYFEQADTLPITRQRLEQRLRMLEPSHFEQLQAASQVASPRRHPLTRTDQEVNRQYRTLVQQPLHPKLREVVDHVMDQRTILAALRRRKRGLGRPDAGELWGVGRWVGRIEQHWDDPDLRLASVFPWIPEARGHLESSEAVNLERLLMGSTWRRLTQIAEASPFGFEVVVAYVVKWDISERWLSYDASASKQRFQELIAEVIDGQAN
jgi:hypothetical protein